MIKGDKVNLIAATLKDRQNIYQWCFQSETTKYHSGLPHYPEIPIATYEEFCTDHYEEYFFTGAKPNHGQGFLIIHSDTPVGFISYSCFHLKPPVAELDIWMNSERNCGKGFGTDAIVSLGNYLKEAMGIGRLIIAPAAKNKRAVNAYQKAGFEISSITMGDFLLDKYIPLYGNGDYGVENTVVMVKTL